MQTEPLSTAELKQAREDRINHRQELHEKHPNLFDVNGEPANKRWDILKRLRKKE